MDEECDYNSPIGEIIKQINALIKKPKIDEQLGLALDSFGERINQQEKFMRNGIFRINFAEAALFIQSSADLYGKKVDLLWDQLLEFHTRLIEYDCAHEKEKGKNLNDDVIKQLEERRNRYKRKKKFKLVLAQDDNVEEFLFDKQTNEDKESEKRSTVFETDENLERAWKNLELKSEKIKSVPNAVYRQQLKMYRMKNYYIMKSQDFDVLDSEDGEFNTKYSRIPGWHHIHHLFEYNSKGLLPDKNNLIATLRLGAYLRVKFLRDQKIPFSAPFSEYKEKYVAFKKQLFEEEAKKWQNMPLDTLKDLRKQMEYLSREERDVLEVNSDSSVTETSIRDDQDQTSRNCENEKSGVAAPESLEKIIDDCDDDSLFELSFGCSGELSKSDLMVRLEKLSSDIINTKLRQDSGFFETEYESEDERSVDKGLEVREGTDNAESGTNPEQGMETNEKPNENGPCGILNETTKETGQCCTGAADSIETAETDKSLSKNIEDPRNSEQTENTTVIESNVNQPPQVTILNNNMLVEAVRDSIVPDSEQDKENVNPNISNTFEDFVKPHRTDNFDSRSVMSDHSYCRTPVPNKVLEENNNVLQKNNNSNTASKDIMEPFICGGTRIIPRIVKIKLSGEKKSKMKPPTDESSPPKRRKLSQKQLEKLYKNLTLTAAVKEMKFEKFFSQNYQPQLGEGEIEQVDYESEVSDGEDNAVEPPPVEKTPSETRSRTVHDCDDIYSIISDHNYCQPSDAETHDESGYISVNQSQPLASEGGQESFCDKGVSPFERGGTPAELEEMPPAMEEMPPAKEAVSRDTIEPSLESEYQKLLESLRESRRAEDEGVQSAALKDIDPRIDQQLRDQEKQESRDRVNEWRDTITPILQNLKERDFNIHEYGSRIMEDMEVEETKHFSSIVDGKSSAEVVRYFIASLQLANTYNIEVCGAKKGELSNDSYKIKLLKKDRYHEHLTDYQAPSEETFRERLKRVREMQNQEPEESTRTNHKPNRFTEPPIKKRRNSRTSIQFEHKNPPDVQCTKLSTICPREVRINLSNDLKSSPATASKSILKTSQPNTLKGKNIIKSPKTYGSPSSPVSTKTYLPSTSRHVHFSGSTRGSPEPPVSDVHPTRDNNLSNCSPQSDSTEEVFRDHLLSLQDQNPSVQLCSTPQEERQLRFVERSSKGRSLVFE